MYNEQALKIINKLADGVDPTAGELLPDDSPSPMEPRTAEAASTPGPAQASVPSRRF